MYKIPVISLTAHKQKKAARLIHLCVAFLCIGNAYGTFRSTAHPDLIFIVVQIAMSIMIGSQVIAGERLYRKPLLSHNIFRAGEILCLLYATWFFSSVLHQSMMSWLMFICAGGLTYLFFTEQQIFQKQMLLLDEEGVRLPAAESRKRISWQEVDNLRIRNDYVSINTKENRFFQYETDGLYNEAALDEMNAWCFRHLTPSNNPLKTD